MGVCDSANEGRREKNQNKRKPVELSETEVALLDCKNCRDKIKQYIRRLENRQQKTREKAKDLLRSKERERAKIYVRQSKLHGEQIKIADGQLEMINEQINQIQSTATMADCMKCLKQGNEVLKNLQKSINVEEWEKVRDDMDELKEKDREIADFLKENNIDEAQYDQDVNNELDKLLNEIQGGSNELQLPNVPKEEIKEDEEKNKIKVKQAVEA